MREEMKSASQAANIGEGKELTRTESLMNRNKGRECKILLYLDIIIKHDKNEEDVKLQT